MTDAAAAAETFLEAATLNRDDALRKGAMLVFPGYGQVVMTGDLHGHRRNLAKLKSYCDLEHAGARHAMVHEVIHADVDTLGDRDMSHEVLLDAARWKCAFPDQVHFLQSNHELAQLHGHEITKNGRAVTVEFDASVRATYGSAGDKVCEAIRAFIRSYPLAGRTPNRVFLSHSLPSPRELPAFDASVLHRDLTDDDLADGGAAYKLVWGRYHTEAALDCLRDLFDVDYFICGHQPQDMGHDVVHDRMVILASEHNHGVFLPLDLGKPATLDRLVSHIRPFAGVL